MRIRPRSRLVVAFLATFLATFVFASVARAQTTTAPAAEVEAAAASVEWRVESEHWYVMEIADARAGWMSERTLVSSEGYRSDAESFFRISRGAIQIEISSESAFTETRDGEPIELHFVQNMSAQKLDTRWVFHDDHVESISKQGGRTVTTTMKLPTGDWLTPRAAQRYSQEQTEAGAEVIEFRLLEGEAGIEPVSVRLERASEEAIEISGKTVPVTVWRMTNSMMPNVTSITKISEDGVVMYEEIPLGMFTMIRRAVTREEAIEAGAAPPPELMLSMFAPVDRPIERVFEATNATLRLRTRAGEMPVLPSAGAQRVDAGDDARSVMVRIDLHDNVSATPEELADPAYLEKSAMADSTDPLIRKLAARACRGVSDDPMAKADALRDFVYEHISAKALETAFASASETARTRTGDCSEHGVLLCAMLRAEEIPARVATGLVYVDFFAGERNIFGWHMWTQALIDGRWVDFDATLPGRYHAGHVLTGTSSLGDGASSADMSSAIVLIGNLEVDVVDVGYERADSEATPRERLR